METIEDHQANVGSLTAKYTTETYEYFPSSGGTTVDVQVYCVTTTVGGNLVSQQRDLTGIMIWPATHLLCHYLALQNNVGDCVLELCCGVGMVGVVSLSLINIYS